MRENDQAESIFYELIRDPSGIARKCRDYISGDPDLEKQPCLTVSSSVKTEVWDVGGVQGYRRHRA